MNIPNLLTILRTLLVPVFGICYFSVDPVFALGVYALAAGTDFLDGYLARRNNQITDFGKVMDPLADKLMQVTTVVCLAIDGRIRWWIVMVVTGKELIMIVGGLLLYKRKDVVVYSNWVGKLATGTFSAAIVLTFFQQYISPYDYYALVLAVALSLIAMVQYGVRNVLFPHVMKTTAAPAQHTSKRRMEKSTKG